MRANPKAFANADDILALYREPDDSRAGIDEDAQTIRSRRWRSSASAALAGAANRFRRWRQRFEQELDLKLTACEFGLPIDDFLKRLDASDAMSRRFAALRTPGGVIKRDVFATGFGEAATVLKLINGILAAGGLG